MGLYVSTSDFKGQDKLARDKFSTSELDIYIDKYEVRYLQDLMGCDMYEDFKTDFAILGNAPTDPKFVAIWEAFCFDDDCGIKRSEGIKSMLALFIYFEYLRDSKVKGNIGGININTQVNSTEAPFHVSNIYTNYNDALESYWAIQWYIYEYNPNAYNYENFNGQLKDLISWI